MRYDLAEQGAERFSDRPALWFSGRWYSYRELDERAMRLAQRLATMGVEAGARVGIVASNHLAHFDLLHAAPKLGFTLVPYNPRLSARELAEAVQITAPVILFHDARSAVLAQGALSGVRIDLETYGDWLRAASAVRLPRVTLSPDSVQMILFTGGTTGTPKAALISYRQMAANAQGTASGWSLRPEDCAIQATPCFHAGINVLATPLLAIGGRVVLMGPFDPGEYLRLAAQEGATLLFMVPSMYQALAAHADFTSTDLHRVRWAISGGAPCATSLAQRFRARGIAFCQGFGMTEVGVNCFGIPLDEAARHPDAVGYPLPHVQAQIRRPDGSDCPADEVGELTLRGEALCAGYLNAPQAWAEACRDGWFWTGDLAVRDAQGRYSIRGRRKDMYISGGENVYPSEVERALGACRGVAECVVLAVPDATWGEAGLAAVVVQPGFEPSATQLREQLRTRLAAYKIPAEFLFLDALPRTSVGKVDVCALRKLIVTEAA